MEQALSARPTLESFEKVKLVPLENHEDGDVAAATGDLIANPDKLFLPASFLDDVLGGDGACT